MQGKIRNWVPASYVVLVTDLSQSFFRVGFTEWKDNSTANRGLCCGECYAVQGQFYTKSISSLPLGNQPYKVFILMPVLFLPCNITEITIGTTYLL